MPNSLARFRVQRNQGIGEEIVANAVGAVPVGRCGTGGDIDDAAFSIEGHAGPVVGGTAVGPRVLRPGVVAELLRMRDGVKSPAQLARAHIVGANVARGRGQSFWS